MDNNIIKISVGIVVLILVIYIIYIYLKKSNIQIISKIVLPNYTIYHHIHGGKHKWNCKDNNIIIRLMDENWINKVYYFKLKIIDNDLIDKYNFKMDYEKNELSYNINDKEQIILSNTNFDLEK